MIIAAACYKLFFSFFLGGGLHGYGNFYSAVCSGYWGSAKKKWEWSCGGCILIGELRVEMNSVHYSSSCGYIVYNIHGSPMANQRELFDVHLSKCLNGLNRTKSLKYSLKLSLTD